MSHQFIFSCLSYLTSARDLKPQELLTNLSAYSILIKMKNSLHVILWKNIFLHVVYCPREHFSVKIEESLRQIEGVWETNSVAMYWKIGVHLLMTVTIEIFTNSPWEFHPIHLPKGHLPDPHTISLDVLFWKSNFLECDGVWRHLRYTATFCS